MAGAKGTGSGGGTGGGGTLDKGVDTLALLTTGARGMMNGDCEREAAPDDGDAVVAKCDTGAGSLMNWPLAVVAATGHVCRTGADDVNGAYKDIGRETALAGVEEAADAAPADDALAGVEDAAGVAPADQSSAGVPAYRDAAGGPTGPINDGDGAIGDAAARA